MPCRKTLFEDLQHFLQEPSFPFLSRGNFSDFFLSFCLRKYSATLDSAKQSEETGLTSVRKNENDQVRRAIAASFSIRISTCQAEVAKWKDTSPS